MRRVMIVIGLSAVLTAGVGACGNDDGELPPPASPVDEPATSPPAPTLDARDAEAWDEIQAKFDGFMETWIKWAAEGRPGGFVDPATVELNEHAQLLLRDEAVAQLTEEARDGHVRTGRPEWRGARLLGIDWDREVQDRVIPEAVFDVCVDDAQWIVVDAETGEPVGVEPSGPELWTITAWWAEEREFGPDGWAPSQREVDGPC